MRARVVSWLGLATIGLAVLLSGCGGAAPRPPLPPDDDEGEEAPLAAGAPGGPLVRLTVAVSGGSSVEFHDHTDDSHVCGDTTLSGHRVRCAIDVRARSEVALRRTEDLPAEEEARWRLASWGTLCPDLDVDTEPRGGRCVISMAADAETTVSFERRAVLRVTHPRGATAPPFEWRLTAEPQMSGGNPLAFRESSWTCRPDAPAATQAGVSGGFRERDPCDLFAMYDVGTAVTIQVGAGIGDVSAFEGWGGACASSGRAATCTFTLTDDATVTTTFRQR